MTKIVYDENHWFNLELAELAKRLLMERRSRTVQGGEVVAPAYDPAMIGMVVQSLSSMLGKMTAILCGAKVDPALISAILEGASQNAFDEATAMANRFRTMRSGDCR
jgi:hypothetical protein